MQKQRDVEKFKKQKDVRREQEEAEKHTDVKRSK